MSTHMADQIKSFLLSNSKILLKTDPSPRDLPYPGIEPESFMSPALTDRFFITTATWELLHSLPLYAGNIYTYSTSNMISF